MHVINSPMRTINQSNHYASYLSRAALPSHQPLLVPIYSKREFFTTIIIITTGRSKYDVDK